MQLPLILVLVFSLLMLTPLSQHLPQNVFDCGVPQIKITKLIVHGYNTIRSAWPWHSAIFHEHGSREEYVCGGTLVTKKHVITAEHCLRDKKSEKSLPVNNILVKLGVYQLNSTEDEIQHREIREIHRFDNISLQGHRNDIAILELTLEAEFGKYVQPACVSLAKKITGELGTVIGWGVDERNKVSTVLKSARLPVVDYFTCVKSDPMTFGSMLDEGMFCAGYTNGTAACNGDSGGGIFFKENGAWHLGGIVSFSQMREDGSGLCFNDGYGAFTRIYTYLAWIQSVTKLYLPFQENRCQSQAFDPTVNYANVLPQDCGISLIKNPNLRNETDVFEFPWMAILGSDKNVSLDVDCVGTLIDKRYVLTTYACAAYYEPEYVRLGEHTVGNDSDCNEMRCAPPTKQYGVECIVLYRNATNFFEDIPDADFFETLWLSIVGVALIRLERDVIFDDHIRPICLPVHQSLRSLAPVQYFLTGWDMKSKNRPTLLKVSVTPSSINCEDTSYLICSFDNQTFRPSVGSPLVHNVHHNGERVVQYGSHRDEDGSYYINITKYVDWILANIHP